MNKISKIKENLLGMRPSWDEYFMLFAIVASSRSSCKNVKAGSVIVQDNKIIGTGYNGAPPGLKNCLEIGCRKEKIGLKYAESLNSGTCIGVHSELNALGHLTNIINQNFTIYTTIFPCPNCIKNLLAYKIKRIVFKKEYSAEEYKKARNLLKETSVRVDQLDLSQKRIKDILFNQKKLFFNVF